MRPGKDFNTEHTSSYPPSATALRILLAESAYHGLHVEDWDVSGAFLRAPRIFHVQPEPKPILKTPARSNGEPTMLPGTIAVANKARQGAPDARFIREHNRKLQVKQWGWTELSSEPSAFVFVCPYTKKIARLLSSTDDFFISTESMKLFSEWRQNFNQNLQVTVRSTVRPHLGMRIEIIKDEYIQIRNPKLIDNLLAANGLSSAKPAAFPYTSSLNIDITTAADGTFDARQKEWYNSTVGVVRYLPDTNHPETGWVLAKLARALSNPCTRHV